jgi:multidrug resistance efflux pump
VTQTLPSTRAFGAGAQALDRIDDERQRLEVERRSARCAAAVASSTAATARIGSP